MSNIVTHYVAPGSSSTACGNWSAGNLPHKSGHDKTQYTTRVTCTICLAKLDRARKGTDIEGGGK